MKRVATLFAVSSLALVLAACSRDLSSPINNSAFFGDPLPAQYQIDDLRDGLRNKDYTVRIRRVTDARTPVGNLKSVNRRIMHEYNPDKLAGGSAGFIRSTLETFYDVGPRKDEIMSVEIDLRDMQLDIREGNYWSGNGGQYVASIQADVIARDEKGKVLINREMRIHRHVARRLPGQAQYSVAEDEANATETMQMAVYELAYNIVKGIDRPSDESRKPPAFFRENLAP